MSDRSEAGKQFDLISNGVDVDAFGRQRVSFNKTLFYGQFRYGIHPLIWKTLTATGGAVTYNSATNDVTLSCTASTGSRAVIESPYLIYQPGKSNLIKITANPNSAGYSLRYVVRKGGVDTPITQDLFNRDKLDGSGFSKFNMDFTKAHILSFDFQHLGVGIIRFCVEKETGETILSNVVENPNNITSMYMNSAQLPLRCEAVADADFTYKRFGYFNDLDGIFFEFRADVAIGSFTFFCGAVETENGDSREDDFALPFSAETAIGGRAMGVSLLPFICIRPRTTYESKTNRSVIIPTGISIGSAATTRTLRMKLILNPTLTNPSFSAVDANSAMEFDIAATALSGGTVLRSWTINLPGNFQIPKLNLIERITLGLNVAGTTADILCLALNASTASANVVGSLLWKEYQ